MRASIGILMLTLVLAATGCDRGADPTGALLGPDRPLLPMETNSFVLREGEEAVVAGDGTRVRFDRVTQDSRCPTGVHCVWEGEGVTALTARSPQGAVQAFELRIAGLSNDPGPPAGALGHRFRLLRLSPYPDADPPGPPEIYEIELEVDG